MRESLTVLAGLLVLALLAALIGPGFVDWRAYRPQFEARLSEALGVETQIGGDISLRLLPSPRIALQDVRIGVGSAGTSAATAEQATVELALTALARGEFRFSEARLDGATLQLVADETGAVRLPERTGKAIPAEARLDRLTISRSALVWREAGRPVLTIAPIAAEVSAVSLAGPWRFEGEVDGASLRITTGELEEGGRLRAKANLTGEDLQLAFDGSFVFPPRQGGVAAELDGVFNLSPGGSVALSGRVRGGSRQLELAGLALDLAGGAARLEGEGHYLPGNGTGALALRARRLDADALAAALAERQGFARALHGLPGSLDVSLDLDQLIWHGEDFSGFALRGRLHDAGLSETSASVRVGGALIGASGSLEPDGAEGRLNLKAEDARRLALLLGRAGLDPALADFIARLGRVDADATGSWSAGQMSFQHLIVAGSSGLRLEASGELGPTRLAAKAAVNGLVLDALPPGTSLAGLFDQPEIALELSLNNARFRSAPPGSANLDIRREGESWRLRRLSVEGFGGVSVTGAGALLAEGGEISGRVRAPRLEALTALAGPLLPEAAAEILARTSDGLARLDAGFRLTRAASGETGVSAEGMAAAGKLTLDGLLDRGGAWRRAALNFELNDRRQVFTAFGLPAPAQGGPARLALSLGSGRATGSLAGPGLSLVVDEGADGRQVAVQADGPGQILAEGPARLLPDGVLDAHARLLVTAEATRLDAITAHLGGATASGSLLLPREGPYTGRLALPAADLRRIMAASIGSAAPSPGSTWPTGRFGQVPGLPAFDIAIEVGSFALLDGVVLDKASFTLRSNEDGLRLEKIGGSLGDGRLAGRLGLRRDGGLAQLNGRLELKAIDLGRVSRGAIGGRASGQIELGGSGETPARLIAGLSGAGSLALSELRLARFDPGAYARVIANTGEDASESDAGRLQERLAQALDKDAWALGQVAVPFTLAGGLIRIQPFAFERNGLKAEVSGVVDLRALTGDLRLGLKPLGPLPKGWPGDAPQIGIAWRGPLTELRRESDVSALSNTVAARALAREIERVEAFEADARERAMHSRRLRAEREMRENERRLNEFLKAEEERRLAEQKRAEEARQRELERQQAEEKRAEEARRAEQAKAEQEIRRRVEAEDRGRAAERAPAQRPGPLVLPGAPLQSTAPGTASQPLPPPLELQRPTPRVP